MRVLAFVIANNLEWDFHALQERFWQRKVRVLKKRAKVSSIGQFSLSV